MVSEVVKPSRSDRRLQGRNSSLYDSRRHTVQGMGLVADKPSQISRLAFDTFEEVSDDHDKWIGGLDALADFLEHVVVNVDKRESISPGMFEGHKSAAKFCTTKNGVMQGLFSCLFYMNGGVGGDVQGFCQGRWAGDHLKIVEKEHVPENHEYISQEVLERLRYYL